MNEFKRRRVFATDSGRAWPTRSVTSIVTLSPGGGSGAYAQPLFAMMPKNAARATPEEFSEFASSEIKRWSDVVKAGAKLD
jgi:tripartite-type tricarboxylate transporter receptor subunit TctC